MGVIVLVFRFKYLPSTEGTTTSFQYLSMGWYRFFIMPSLISTALKPMVSAIRLSAWGLYPAKTTIYLKKYNQLGHLFPCSKEMRDAAYP